MNDLDTRVDQLEQRMLERLLTAQLATTSVIRQAQEKMVERLGRLIDELRDAQIPKRLGHLGPLTPGALNRSDQQ